MHATQHWFVGECMVELRRAGPGMLAQSFAGDVYNTAVYFEREHARRTSCFISAVGADSVSAALLDDATRHQLDVRHVARVAERQPGLYWIETDARGERSFLYWRAHSAARTMLGEDHASALQAQAASCAMLYFSGITLAILDEERRTRLLSLARKVKDAGGMVAFDSNYRPALWDSADTARRWCDAAGAICTHALVTFDDEQQLHGDTAPEQTLRRLLAGGTAEAVVKLGAQGCMTQASGMAGPIAVPAFETEVVDTTAAGDSFNAAYLAARLAGKSLHDSARAGCALAARVVSRRGAIIDAIG